MSLEISNKMKMFYGKEIMFWYDPKAILSIGMKIIHPLDATGKSYFKIKEFCDGGVSLEYIDTDVYNEESYSCKECNQLLSEDYFDYIEKYITGLLKTAKDQNRFTLMKVLEDIETDNYAVYHTRQSICKDCIDKILKEKNVPATT